MEQTKVDLPIVCDSVRYFSHQDGSTGVNRSITTNAMQTFVQPWQLLIHRSAICSIIRARSCALALPSASIHWVPLDITKNFSELSWARNPSCRSIINHPTKLTTLSKDIQQLPSMCKLTIVLVVRLTPPLKLRWSHPNRSPNISRPRSNRSGNDWRRHQRCRRVHCRYGSGCRQWFWAPLHPMSIPWGSTSTRSWWTTSNNRAIPKNEHLHGQSSDQAAFHVSRGERKVVDTKGLHLLEEYRWREDTQQGVIWR